VSLEREQLEVDVLIVGAGPAGLSTALQLRKLMSRHNRDVEPGVQPGTPMEPSILVVEKGAEVGAHSLSGAVVDPRGFNELLDGLSDEAPPYEALVSEDRVHFLTSRHEFKLPVTPPPLRNHGHYVASLGRLVRWLGSLCELHEIEVYPGFPAAELLFDGPHVRGARIGDSGVGRDGEPKSNYEPGIEVIAKVTVLAEGVRGTLAQQAIRRLDLSRQREPQIYSVGVKELWEAGRDIPPGLVLHTLGYPVDSEDFGGGFLYSMRENRLALGLVVGLDSPHPSNDAHLLLQRWKTHALIRPYLEGGKLVSYGAKALPEGGYWAMPQTYADGLIIVGDSAGFLNSQRLKGIHLAVKSGILAAETIFDALKSNDFSSQSLSAYQKRFVGSWASRELYRVRNFRQGFQAGAVPGFLRAGLQFLTGGRGIRHRLSISPGYECMKRISGTSGPVAQESLEFDKVLTFDKLTSVYYSDTSHEEDQPSHLKILEPSICDTRCGEEYGNPCQHFCPAGVYEILSETKTGRLRINFSNCVHCKTCEIADPYQVILWTLPEGGGGPNWKQM
jgi:electron-transferring-flavoprotein dehydrogenase